MSEFHFVDRDGNEISMEEASALLLDVERRRVGSTIAHGHHVSTVWLSLQTNMEQALAFEEPLFWPFETMIFPRHDGDCALEGYQERYPNEEAARAGHDRAIATARDAPCGD